MMRSGRGNGEREVRRVGDKKEGGERDEELRCQRRSGRELILRNISIFRTGTLNCSGLLLIGIHPDDVTLWGDVKRLSILKTRASRRMSLRIDLVLLAY
jgi:hypothetical protein